MATRRDDPRRWRFDDRGGDPVEAPSWSGRLTVGGLVVGVLVLWLGLDLAFRGWRERYRALAEFGAREVAPAVDPLAQMSPPDVPPDEWRRAVADTHAMLLALTGAGVLDRGLMERLRDDLRERVAGARPETAKADLARLWDDLERQAGPVIAPDLIPPPPNSRHAARNPRPPRPKLLGTPRPAR